MFSSAFLALPSRYPARRGPSGFSPSCLRSCCFSPSCLSPIPAAHSVLKKVSPSQPSKQSLPSDCWLSAESCQLQLPSPAAVICEATHQSLRRASLSPVPLRARKPAHATPLSPLGATLTKNLGGTKSTGEGADSRARLRLHAETRATLFHSIVYFTTARGGGPMPIRTRRKNAGYERRRELDYVEWNPAFCIAVRASGFFMNVSQTRPLR
jgi:hypothetical protein